MILKTITGSIVKTMHFYYQGYLGFTLICGNERRLVCAIGSGDMTKSHAAKGPYETTRSATGQSHDGRVQLISLKDSYLDIPE